MEFYPVAGQLDPPVVGRFVNDQGTFECDDVVGGHLVKVRFLWRADVVVPAWRQFFSYDGGASWKLNWVMTLSRREELPVVQ